AAGACRLVVEGGRLAEADVPGLVEAEVLLGDRGEAAAALLLPPLGEGVVAGLGEVVGQRRRRRQGLVVVVVVADALHRVDGGAGDRGARGDDSLADQRRG